MKDNWFYINNQFYNLSKFWKLEPLAIKSHSKEKRFIILGCLNLIDPRPEIELKTIKHSRTEVFIGESSPTTHDDCLIRIKDILTGKYDIHSPPSTATREAQRGSEANTLEYRVEIGRKVAELRINAAGSRGIAWWKIRERLELNYNEFHKAIRLEDHFKESVLERIESFKGGWECQVDLKRLCGFEPTGEWLNRIEACRP